MGGCLSQRKQPIDTQASISHVSAAKRLKEAKNPSETADEGSELSSPQRLNTYDASCRSRGLQIAHLRLAVNVEDVLCC